MLLRLPPPIARLRALLIAPLASLLLAFAPDEPPLAATVVQRWREQLAAGRVQAAQEAVAAMVAAPHSRAGLLLYEAALRAERRIARADAKQPDLARERAALLAERAAADPSATSVRRRLDERLALLERDEVEQAALRQVEERLREVARAGYRRVVALLLDDAADELARLLLQELVEEREAVADLLLIELLGAVRSPRVMVPLMELVRDKATAVELKIAALVALGRRGDAGATPAAAMALGHADWRVQVEAVEALRRFHQPSSIALLIQQLDRADGRLRDDLGRALVSLTGQRFAADAATWRRWWAEAGGSFVPPPAPAAPLLATAADPASGAEGAAAGADAGGAGGTQFFGVGSFSKRLVFVVDLSGSMREPAPRGTDRSAARTKLEVAASQLAAAIAALPSDARFEVITYADTASAVFGALELADDAHRQQALAAVRGRGTGQGTNLFGALEAAFAVGESAKRRGSGGPAVDTIFFLTDGQPTAGRIVAPERILAAVADWNRTRRVRLHAIGIGSHDRAFLAALAEQNSGTYVAR
ncbi:MAG: VWA domain-containing protein [Planctomycetes bacterium]|nr:VWA domain-containing protein [Planctomycetota bacterium]